MKSRVAVPAALIALIALVLIPVYQTLNIAADRNASVLESLRGICQVAAAATGTSDLSARADVVSALTLPGGAACQLRASDGSLLCATPGGGGGRAGTGC